MNRANYSLDFDGSNDYVNTNSALDLWVQPFALEAWINIDANNIPQHVFHKRTSAVNPFFMLGVTTGGKLEMFTRNSGGTSVIATGATTVSTGVWHHILGYRSATHVYVYLDGVLDGTTAGAAVSVDNGQNCIIGADIPNGKYFNGRISRCINWYQPASIQDILDKRFTHLRNETTNLYYAFDEGTGTTLTTLGGFSNGTVQGATWSNDAPPIQGSGSILIN